MNEITSDVTERRSTARTLTERILIRAPTGSDAAVMAEVLGSRGFQVVVIADLDSLVAEWGAGAGMVRPMQTVLQRSMPLSAHTMVQFSINPRLSPAPAMAPRSSRAVTMGRSPMR